MYASVKKENMSEELKKRLSDGKQHKVKTTGLPTLWIDGVEVYRAKNVWRISPIMAVGIGFAVGIVLGGILF